MEILFIKYLTPPNHVSCRVRVHPTKSISEVFAGVPLNLRRLNKQLGHSHIIPWSKRSAFQDFQDFSKPLRLLPATEATVNTEYTTEAIISSLELDEFSSFYVIELCTSKDFASSLSNINAAILLCLIDANGNSLLQRIPAVSLQKTKQGKEMAFSESIHFQRGSVEIITFEGSKLEKIEALWIGLESGSWTLDGVCLAVINGPLSVPASVEDISKGHFDGLLYKFEANNVLLGEGGGVSVAELRPLLVSDLSQDRFSSLLSARSSPFSFQPSNKMLIEDGMREYADLKFSLLLYDLILILSGSSILIFFSSEKSVYSFLIGGIAGFLYLLLLQRSVDALPVPAISLEDGQKENSLQAFVRFKRPWLALALIMATTAVAVKYGMGGSTMSVTPTELFIGVSGFLTCKIAVVLAAFKPIQRSK